jgi:hypothetical protein
MKGPEPLSRAHIEAVDVTRGLFLLQNVILDRTSHDNHVPGYERAP